ncbi:MAG: DNA replication/repair protein RecF [Pseudomonadales bacterium]
MKLTGLEISGVRNLSSVSIKDLAQINIFSGPNGAGKTSVLEAIHILGLARSFRGTQLQPVIQYHQNTCTVFGKVLKNDDPLLAVGVKRAKKGGFRIRIDGQDEKSLIRLAETLPIQLINSTAYALLEGGPKQRRQFIDWGVFHVEPSFYDAWRRMQRCLKQRNAVLRTGRGSSAHIDRRVLLGWNQELIDVAELVDQARQRYFESFYPVFNDFLGRLIDLSDLSVSYSRGWEAGRSLAEVLEASIERDSRRGFTHYGPHRADLKIQINGLNAGQVLSRGQQKLVVCALRLAQCELMIKTTQKRCVLLIDDLPAEIDASHQGKLCSLLDSLDTQLFMTCVSQDDLVNQPWEKLKTLKVFQLDKGQAEEIKSQGTGADLE